LTRVPGYFAVSEQHHFAAAVRRVRLAQVIRVILLVFLLLFFFCIQTVALRELFLRKNNVSDIQELRWLSGLQHLHVLWLAENPVTATLNCA
jgi:hypothetical protein